MQWNSTRSMAPQIRASWSCSGLYSIAHFRRSPHKCTDSQKFIKLLSLQQLGLCVQAARTDIIGLQFFRERPPIGLNVWANEDGDHHLSQHHDSFESNEHVCGASNIRHDKAVKAATKAIESGKKEFEPNSVETIRRLALAHFNLGFELESLDKLDEAVKQYKRALQFVLEHLGNKDPLF